jgi:hypothetical protein
MKTISDTAYNITYLQHCPSFKQHPIFRQFDSLNDDNKEYQFNMLTLSLPKLQLCDSLAQRQSRICATRDGGEK